MQQSHQMKIAYLALMIAFLLEFSFSDQSCISNRLYCGHQVPQVPQRQKAQNTTLWQCESDGKTLTIFASCNFGCKAVNGGNSYCLCLQNKYYCGHELNEIGWKADENSLYNCTEKGLNTSLIETCKHQCMVTSHSQSVCFGQCQDGKNYCGYKLKELGWEGYELTSLYRCRGGNEATILSNCTSCDSEDTDTCDCTPGRYYCGHELYEHLGWTTFKTRPMELFKCKPDGASVFDGLSCQECISGDHNPRCDCKIDNIYCGSSLRARGWDGYENDTLYQCRGGNKTSVWSKCSPGTCHSHYCKCNPGQHYCGHELYEQLGWTKFKSRRMELGICASNGSWVFFQFDCDTCYKTGNSSKCDCISDYHYCGHELLKLGFVGHENNTLYQCDGSYDAKYMKTCHGECIVGKRHSSCGGECLQGTKYCGSKINQMGYNGYRNNSVYLCENNFSLIDSGETNVLCSQRCTPGLSYCGYEVQYIWDIAKDDLQARYKCKNDKSLQRVAQCINSCINDGKRAFCRCVPDSRFCGYILEEMGLDGLENYTLYQCQGGNATRVFSKCPLGTCHYDHCKTTCKPGQYYCGHELYHQLGWGNFESERSKLFKCLPNGTHVFNFDAYTCQECISGDQLANCECKIGNTYCGYNLRERGWEGYETDTLYLCERGHNGSRLTELMPCGDGKCKDNHCECTRDKLYCGHQLYTMGYRQLTSVWDRAIGRCTNGSYVAWIGMCSVCHNTGVVSRCGCLSGNQYCGHELIGLGWDGYGNHSLYTCVDNGLNASLIEVCSVLCKAIPDRLSFCYRQCQDGKKYCGSTLKEIGLDGYENDKLYLCERGLNNGSSLTELMSCGDGKCRNHACECTRDTLYCGHVLNQMGWTNTTSVSAQWLYHCIDGTIVRQIAICTLCHNTGVASRCDCTPGAQYCGRELLQMGLEGYENHSIYNCANNGLNANLIKTCLIHCTYIAYSRSPSYVLPVCARQCDDGQNYCGYVLNLLGWNGYDNDTLYKCRGGNDTTVWSKCNPGTCESNLCKCNPGRYYCGHELDDQLGWGIFETRRKKLFKCAPDGTEVFDFNKYTCQECISGDRPPHCECKIGNTYCGSGLHIRGWDGYENNTLYICERGLNGSRLTEAMPCDGKCNDDGCDCTRDKLYCGHELYQMGWRNYESEDQSLYYCTNGRIKRITSCGACHNTEGVSRCDCLSGIQYCGHELLKLGWEGYENHYLYKCVDKGLNASMMEFCSTLCKESERHSFCFRQCRDSQNYCGNRLNELGWDRFDNDTLYKCNGENDTRVLSKCPPGKCDLDRCECIPGRYYCGHELDDQLGWTSLVSRRMELFKCDNGTAMWIADCNQCNNTGTALMVSEAQYFTCDCRAGSTYCGYTLRTMGFDGYENDTLYLCEKGQNDSHISELTSCGDGKCHRNRCECTRDKLYCGHQLYKMGWRYLSSFWDQAWLARCTNGSSVDWITSCNKCYNTENGSMCGCTFGTNYCGSKINQMGHRGYNNDSLYYCKDALTPLVDTGQTNILCSHECIPGRSYCGHALQYVRNIAEGDLQTRYICNNDKSFQSTAQCGRCITNDVTGAYCHCVPGWRHCASVIYHTGWKGFGESWVTTHLPKNFTNDTIFQCKDEENIEFVESCGSGRCRHKFFGGAYCVCSHGNTYCGHELYEHYNSMDTKLDPNYIYKCLVSTVVEQERCNKCLRLNGTPICEPEFLIPWYWIGGGIAALVLFSFAFLLIRHILQHRRLKKLMERKRIDVAQLTVSKKKLGHGHFGEVMQGIYTNSEGKREVALKLAKGRIDAANCFLQEVMCLDIVNHQNIIKVFGVCLNFIDKGGNSVPALVLEYMNGGSSISYMRSERNRLNGRDLLHIFQDICQAGNHLCKLGFIHRDIAARNILVQNNPQTGHVTVAKLTDFGLAKDIGKQASMYKDRSHDETKLPFRYLAPEGFDRCFCFKSDVWSFGVFMWELYTIMEEEDVLAELRLEQGRSGPMPYSELNSWADVLSEACSERKLNQPKRAPEKMYQIMRQCWDTKPDSRPSFEELINSFTLYGNGNIIEPRVTFLPKVNSEKNNGAHNGKENKLEEKDNQHDQGMYAAPS